MASISVPTIAAVGSEVAADGAAAAAGTASAAAVGTAAGSAALTASTAASLSTAAAGATAGFTTASIAGSSVFSFGNALAAGGLLSSGVSAYGQHAAGVAASNMDAQKARVEQISAGQKQIAMRQNLLKSLSAQNASTLGAIGTGIGSGFGANAMRQITQNQNDLAANTADESAQVSLLDQAGSNARASGNLGAAGAGIGGLSGFAKNFDFGNNS